MDKQKYLKDIASINKGQNAVFCELNDGIKLSYSELSIQGYDILEITATDKRVIFKGNIKNAPAGYSRIINRMKQINTGHGGKRIGAGRKPDVANFDGRTEKKHQSFYCTKQEAEFLREVLKEYRDNHLYMNLSEIVKTTFMKKKDGC